ncbi:Uncharacterized membrane protein HdeD, DUF308 family [Streptomyces sp. DvalAA-14]|uniref:DUF308 domain-containing protein n=1 Tax=unclassified Streptomyces TaxID=2593676 RepID=UPI00081BBB9F|nr:MULTISPECIES: DUF308 domain-containing protein [unclassified Streptomyces]MYS22923.1 DUF308 domain-containing protein [Streptomyces sp. SID4948]SCE24638.1 Uncharacterized membrane protein HdeD, DUF308 family [Streptomyces sp. DvalAA-14]
MSLLLRIHLVRGLAAIAWAVVFSTVHDALSGASVVLLIAYPLIDVVASLLDARADPGTRARTLQLFGTALSAAAAVALGVCAVRGPAAVLFTFGVWAIVSGAAQFTVAVRRRGGELGRQWPMLIAGALSVIAGATYLVAALGRHPDLDALTTYTAAGGTFFVLQAATFAWRQRRTRGLPA